MNRKEEFKKGIRDKTRERESDAKETIRKTREVKQYRSRVEQKHTQAFDKLVTLWNPALFLNTNSVEQLQVLRTICATATEVDMERYANKLLPASHVGILVKRMTETRDVEVMSLLAECIAGFTFHKTTQDKAYARAITSAGYYDIVLAILQAEPGEDKALRCNLWRPLMNIADTSMQSATELLQSALFQHYPLEWQRFESDESMCHIMLSIAIVIMENLSKKPDAFLKVVWVRAMSSCRFVQPVFSWREDLNPIRQNMIYVLIKLLNMIFAKSFHYTARDDLFHLVPLEGYAKMLIHYANLKDAPELVRFVCYESLAELATTPIDAIPPVLFGNGITACVMHGIERDTSAEAYHVMANLFGIGILVVKEFVMDLNCVPLINRSILCSTVTTRRKAIFAFFMIVRMCTAEMQNLEYKELSSSMMRRSIVEHDALKCINTMLNVNYGTQAMMDCLEVLEMCLKWDLNLTSIAMENHSIHDTVDQLVYYQNAQISKVATRVADLYHQRDGETREMDYVEAASNLPFSF